MEAVYAIVEPGTPQWEIGVCRFHRSALDADEAYSYDGSTRELLLGADAPPTVLSWSVSSGRWGMGVWQLKLGHNGVEESTVEFLVDADTLQKMSDHANVVRARRRRD